MRIIFLNDKDDDHRYLRLKQEAERLGHTTQAINIYRAILSDKGLIYEGALFDILPNDIIWATSNGHVGHFIIKHLRQRYENVIWPDLWAFDFSDKYMGNSFFSAHGIATPKTIFVNSIKQHDFGKELGSYPCVIKKNHGSMGKDVELVNSKDELEAYIDQKLTNAKTRGYPFDEIFFCVQEYIAESAGTDFRVLCVKDEIIGAIQRTAEKGFKANISLGGTAQLFPVDKELADICKTIMSKGNLLYAGIDFIKSNRGYLAIEVNTSAQFQGFEAATGINVAKKIIEKIMANI